ncbi:DegT/DnrJ/EryC1/StrS family aminotransferase, partial [Candidatus Pacearchaeota archaeon]|nr:DegT/DnrJ/EryC1/StrS family aminotransferase [Candidatus Pacearchaeota archaeon]
FWNVLIAPLLKMCAARKFDPIERFTTESPRKRKKVEKQTQLMPRPFQGLVGMSQLAKLNDFNRQRIRNGNQLLEDLKTVDNIKIPAASLEGENIYMSFAIQVKDPVVFRQKMLRFGVDTHPGDMTFVSHLSDLDGGQKCTIALEAIKSMVHLPVYPQMKANDISKVADAVKYAAS